MLIYMRDQQHANMRNAARELLFWMFHWAVLLLGEGVGIKQHKNTLIMTQNL